jgi:hypothetical protein
MPEPNSGHVISTPAVPGNNWDATEDGDVNAGRWEELMDSGPTNEKFQPSGGEWGDSGVWKQT